MPGAEGTGTGQKVVFPHSLENPVISSGKSGPCFLKAVVPGQKSFFIVGSQIVDVLDHEEILHRLCNLAHTGQHPVGENITVDPRIAVDPRSIAEYR
jgi:hypothetical protein